jgi:hypothetical protein
MKLPFSRAASITVFLFILFELIFFSLTVPLTGYPLLQPTADDATVMAKHHLLNSAGGRVVIVGDSSAMFGLQPSVIEKITGKPVINLGVLSSFTPLGFTELAISAMEIEPKPTAIVFSILPQSVEVNSERARDFNLLGRYLLAYGNNSNIYTPDFSEIRSYWLKKHQFNIFPPIFGGSYSQFLDILKESDGWLEEHSKSYDINSSKISSNIITSEFSLKSMNALKKSSSLRGVPIIFLFNPKPRDQVDEQAYKVSTAKILERLRNDFNFIVPQKDAPIWKNKYFGTVTHLKKIGSDKYSNDIALILENIL